MRSVREWADSRCYSYCFIGDSLFDELPSDLIRKTRTQPVVASDLARLTWLETHLADGADCAVWLDADTWVFDPDHFSIPEGNAAVGRECWIQPDGERWRCYRKAHNAALMFRPGNALLPFYRETAERLLRAYESERVVPQFIGPKLLTALQNASQLPVWEQAGVLSPGLIRNLLDGGGPALNLFRRKSPIIAAANLCASSVARGELSGSDMQRLIDDPAAIKRQLGDAVAPKRAG